MSATALFRPTFTDLRAEIERRVAAGSDAEEIDTLIDQFLAASGEAPAPLVEYDGTVTWLYRAAAESVSVVGDFLGYEPSHTRMARVAGANLFYLTAQIPLDAQLAYAFCVDATRTADSAQTSEPAHYRCDPLNPRQIIMTHPLRSYSVLRMPSAAQVEDISDAGCDVTLHLFASAVLGGLRRVWVHLPAEYSSRTRRYPALFFLNGESYMISAQAPAALDALSAAGEIAPAIQIFVERHTHHDEEDAPADLFARFLAEELLPWASSRYSISPDPRDRILIGASVAGTLALYTALARPDAFAGVAAQSPAPLLLIESVAGQLAANIAVGAVPPRCYVDVGRYESELFVDHAHALCNALLSGGAALSYQEFAGDHSFVGWRAALPDMLSFHLGAEGPLGEL